MCTIGIKPEPVKNVVGFVNVSEVFILFSLCRTKSCILHFSAKVSLEFPGTLHIFQEHSSCNLVPNKAGIQCHEF